MLKARAGKATLGAAILALLVAVVAARTLAEQVSQERRALFEARASLRLLKMAGLERAEKEAGRPYKFCGGQGREGCDQLMPDLWQDVRIISHSFQSVEHGKGLGLYARSTMDGVSSFAIDENGQSILWEPKP